MRILAALAWLLALPGAASAAPFVTDPLSGQLLERPVTLEFRDMRLTDLRWTTTWGQPVAEASGTSVISYGGDPQRVATKVRVSRLRDVDGTRLYTCLSWKDRRQVSPAPAFGSLNPRTLRPCRPPGGWPQPCRGFSVGYTYAQVSARRTSCKRARTVLKAWERRNRGRSGPPPRVQRVRGHRCEFGGRAVVRLTCTRGRRVARATWGD